MATLIDWLTMCAETDEFVENFNRLYGTRLSFKPVARSPIEAMVDRACGHVPVAANTEADMDAFFSHCADLWLRIPVPAEPTTRA